MHEAKVMLETIMRLYYMRHNFEMYDPWITSSMVIIGNMVIDHLASDTVNDAKTLSDHRSTLILSAQGLKYQAKTHHVGALVCIQLHSRMSPGDLQLVRTFVTAAGIDETDRELIAEHSHSHWPVPIANNNITSVEDIRLKNLVKGFDEITLQPEDDASIKEKTPVPTWLTPQDGRERSIN